MNSEQISIVPLLSLVKQFVKKNKYVFLIALILGIATGFWKSRSTGVPKNISATYYLQTGVISEELLTTLLNNLNQKLGDSSVAHKMHLATTDWAKISHLEATYHQKDRSEDDFVALTISASDVNLLRTLPIALENYLICIPTIENKTSSIRAYNHMMNKLLQEVDSLHNANTFLSLFPKAIFSEINRQEVQLELSEKILSFNRMYQNGKVLDCIDYVITSKQGTSSNFENLKINLLKFSFLFLFIALLGLLTKELVVQVKNYENAPPSS